DLTLAARRSVSEAGVLADHQHGPRARREPLGLSSHSGTDAVALRHRYLIVNRPLSGRAIDRGHPPLANRRTRDFASVRIGQVDYNNGSGSLLRESAG